MINGLDLFSGIGGMSIALNEWVRPIAYCEIDPYCQGILLSRMGNIDIAQAPIWDDIRTFGKEDLPQPVEIIYGGFPCQDISVAGLGKGLARKRSGLFWEIVRLAKEIKPKFLFLENVPAITSRGGPTVVREIAEMGYDCRWCVISASSIGAYHKRDRWFLLAHSKSFGMQDSRDQVREQEGQSEPLVPSIRTYWDETECPVCGVADGVLNRLHRIKAMGNAVVPQQAKEAFKILMGLT